MLNYSCSWSLSLVCPWARPFRHWQLCERNGAWAYSSFQEMYISLIGSNLWSNKLNFVEMVWASCCRREFGLTRTTIYLNRGFSEKETWAADSAGLCVSRYSLSRTKLQCGNFVKVHQSTVIRMIYCAMCHTRILIALCKWLELHDHVLLRVSGSRKLTYHVTCPRGLTCHVTCPQEHTYKL